MGVQICALQIQKKGKYLINGIGNVNWNIKV